MNRQTVLSALHTWRYLIAFALGFALTAGAIPQLRFVIIAFHHGGF